MASAELDRASARWRSEWFLLLVCLLTLTLMAALAWDGSVLLRAIKTHSVELLIWSALVALVNLLPVRVGSLVLTLDTPVVLAVAFIYPPSVAALLAFVATVDKREVSGGIPLMVALFNRLQTAGAVLLAGWAFHLTGGLSVPLMQLILATGAALAVDYSVNVTLIVTYQLSRGVTPRRAIGDLRVGDRTHFLALYLSYGSLAVILAQLFLHVGFWATLALFVPILAARQSLIRAQALEALTKRLQSRERLMEQLLDRMIDERRDERLRIASDLHDNVLQSLTRIWMLTQMMGKTERSAPPSMREDVEELFALADDSMQSLRGLMGEMRDSPLARGGLLPTLESLVRDLRLDWEAKIELNFPSEVSLSPNQQVVLYQVAREALMNAIKHARASHILVELRSEDSVELVVRDNGIGFDARAVDESKHFGLGLMRERIRHSGGTLEVTSTLGGGTQIKASLSGRQKDEPA